MGSCMIKPLEQFDPREREIEKAGASLVRQDKLSSTLRSKKNARQFQLGVYRRKVNLNTYDFIKAYFASFKSNKYQKYTLRCIELFLHSPNVSYATRERTIAVV